jgi:tRNA modification GTPase
VKRARAAATTAALRLWVVDGASNEEAWPETVGEVHAGDLCVISKGDLAAGPAANAAVVFAASHGLSVTPASLTGEPGLDPLRCWLGDRVRADLSGAEVPAATRARHRQDLMDAREHVVRALETLRESAAVELAAEDVRLAARSLSRISGRIDPEQVLDRVFARFCIGK